MIDEPVKEEPAPVVEETPAEDEWGFLPQIGHDPTGDSGRTE